MEVENLSLNIVLVNPEIPQNTGNIARTCAATGATLHLIAPLGFSLSDKYLKRAGLDYWHLMTYHVWPDMETFLAAYPQARMQFASTKAPRGYHQAEYRDGDFLVFGCETRGLPENLLEKVYDRCIRIPMRQEARSLNLSNAVAVTLYETLRQTDFAGLADSGELTGRAEENAPWLDYV
jgi:tRNA (cytidine/uridine-2'-O-)-methyltransferase